MFGCTNTTFTDQNGEPEGDDVFIDTDCTSNEHLQQGQDPRLPSSYDSGDAAEDAGEVPLSVHISESDPNSIEPERQDPVGDETCFRACLCGYHLDDAARSIPVSIFAPYQVCDCIPILGTYYASQMSVNTEYIYLTSANITLLQNHGAVSCGVGVGQSGNFTVDLGIGSEWKGVPDNDSMMVPVYPFDGSLPNNSSIADIVVKNNYECFDSFDKIQSVIFNYIQNSGGPSYYIESKSGYCQNSASADTDN